MSRLRGIACSPACCAGTILDSQTCTDGFAVASLFREPKTPPSEERHSSTASKSRSLFDPLSPNSRSLAPPSKIHRSLIRPLSLTFWLRLRRSRSLIAPASGKDPCLLLGPSSGALSHQRFSSVPRLLANPTKTIRDSMTALLRPPSREPVRCRSQLARHCWSLLPTPKRTKQRPGQGGDHAGTGAEGRKRLTLTLILFLLGLDTTLKKRRERD